MKINFPALLLLLSVSNSLYSQWQSVNTGTNCYYRSIQFSDANTAVAVGNGGIIAKTTNGGTNWICNSKKYGRSLNGVCHENASTCYTVGDQGFLLRSSDQGTSWDTVHLQIPGIDNTQPVGNICKLISICFVHGSSSGKGFIVGSIVNSQNKAETGLLLATNDGGNSWTIGQSFTDKLNCVEFFDDNNGIIVGEKGSIYVTNDGGNSWNQKNSGTTQSIRSVAYGNAATAYAVGGNGHALILKTDDGGNTWTSIATDCNYYLSSVKFSTKKKGYAVGGMGTILHTNNGGNHWEEQSVGKINLNAITIAPNGTKFIVGEKGMIYYHQ